MIYPPVDPTAAKEEEEMPLVSKPAVSETTASARNDAGPLTLCIISVSCLGTLALDMEYGRGER